MAIYPKHSGRYFELSFHRQLSGSHLWYYSQITRDSRQCELSKIVVPDSDTGFNPYLFLKNRDSSLIRLLRYHRLCIPEGLIGSREQINLYLVAVSQANGDDAALEGNVGYIRPGQRDLCPSIGLTVDAFGRYADEAGPEPVV